MEISDNLLEADVEATVAVSDPDVGRLVLELEGAVRELDRTIEAVRADLPTNYDIIQEELGEINAIKKNHDSAFSKLEILLHLEEEKVTEIRGQRDQFLSAYRKMRNELIEARTRSRKGSLTWSQSSNSSVKLPKINIPVFSGQLGSWLTFRNLYIKNIHENEELNDDDRHSYLNSLLKDEPLNLIKNLNISDQNYEKAWRIILNHYDDPLKQLSGHVSALLQSTDSKRVSLRQLINSAQQHYAALQSIVQKQDGNPQFDAVSQILICSFLTKTTFAIRSEWEREVTTHKKFYTFTQFLEFMEGRAAAGERAAGLPLSSSGKGIVATVQGDGAFCQYCRSVGHYIFKCEEFKKITPKERNSFVRKQRLCPQCLRRQCNQSRYKKFTCRICKKPHNTLIHCEFQSPPSVTVATATKEGEPPTKKAKAGNSSLTTTTSVKTDTINYKGNLDPENNYLHALKIFQVAIPYPEQSLLATALIRVTYQGKSLTARAFLDSGSQLNFVTKAFQRKIDSELFPSNHTLNSVDGLTTTVTHQTKFKFKSLHSDFKISGSCILLNKIVDHLPANYFSVENWNIPKNIKLADPNFNIPSGIDILIGSSLFWDILGSRQILLGRNLPQLRETKFGWIVTGELRVQIDPQQGDLGVFTVTNLQLSDILEKFWNIEDINERKMMSEEEQECERIFKETTQRVNDGRFMVKLPFKVPPNTLGESKHIALKRFYSLEKKLSSNASLKTLYSQCMEEYLKLGHMRSADVIEGQATYYIPHHAVFKDASSSTKLRVVFDASMKTTSGTSLNQILCVGPVVQPDLLSTIIRFRLHKYAFSADITKMYRQIWLHPDHTQFQRIFWRNSPDEELKTYELRTVTFGVSSAPFLATRCLKYLAELSGSQFRAAKPVLMRDVYVDDVLSGANTLGAALEIQTQLRDLLLSAGFKLNKWCANHETLLQNIPKERQEPQFLLDFSEERGVTTLGTIWVPKSDSFHIKLNLKNKSDATTKRQVLAIIASIYDPMGLLGPVITKAKLIMQKIWQVTVEDRPLDWDDLLPPDLLSEWSSFASQLCMLDQIKIPRHVFSASAETILVELHGFCDASEKAYGAAVYIRSIDSNTDVICSLLASKSRVAPLKKKSLPRLELCAALLLSELINKIYDILQTHSQISTVRLWSDSTVTLSWIHTQSYRLQTFEANRVQKIQCLTKGFIWDHIASEDNPSDDISRGLSPVEFSSTKTWWSGPLWLTTYTQAWPAQVKFSKSESTGLGFKAVRTVAAISTIRAVDFINETFFHKFSDYNKLVRVMAWVHRFSINSTWCTPKISGPLQLFELRNATTTLVKYAQEMHFKKEIELLKASENVNSQSTLKQLSPFMDKDNILRVGGRLENAKLLPYDKKHPIILHPSHPLTKLIVQREHLRHFHAGPQLLKCILRNKIWIIRQHDVVQNCINKCIPCVKRKASVQEQLMANLHEARVNPSTKPFQITGVDYAGPVQVRCHGGRHKFTYKAYIAIFICFSTRAVHLELVSDLSTELFLNALRRFISRRGIPKEIYSDNGRNFLGAKNALNKQLQEFFKENKGTIINFASTSEIAWHFIPPYAPHWGGLWESNIKCMKKYLQTTGESCKFNYEQFYTVLTQVEAILNSRPLIPMGNDPNDLNVLTPSHFLTGEPLTALPSADIAEIPTNKLNHYKQIQQQTQIFWKRWSTEYLHRLQGRTKWRFTKNELKIGDFVLLQEKDVAPANWPMGRVVETHPGKDKRVRLATIRTKNGLIQRTITRLIFLPVTEQ